MRLLLPPAPSVYSHACLLPLFSPFYFVLFVCKGTASRIQNERKAVYGSPESKLGAARECPVGDRTGDGHHGSLCVQTPTPPLSCWATEEEEISSFHPDPRWLISTSAPPIRRRHAF